MLMVQNPDGEQVGRFRPGGVVPKGVLIERKSLFYYMQLSELDMVNCWQFGCNFACTWGVHIGFNC